MTAGRLPAAYEIGTVGDKTHMQGNDLQDGVFQLRIGTADEVGQHSPAVAGLLASKVLDSIRAMGEARNLRFRGPACAGLINLVYQSSSNMRIGRHDSGKLRFRPAR